MRDQGLTPATVEHLVVVGGSGLLGSTLLGAAAERGIRATAVSRTRGPDMVRWHPLEDLAAVLGAPGTVVVNAAGRTEGDLAELEAANAELAARVVAACLSTGTPLLHIGSAAEYGPPEAADVPETAVARPTAPYGASKLRGTDAVLAALAHGLVATVARVFNVAGAWDGRSDPVSEFAAKVVAMPPSGGTMEIRDSSLVRDVAGLGWVAERLVDLAAHVGEVALVNVCTGRDTSFRQLVVAMGIVSGKHVQIVDTAPGGLPRVVGDPTLLHLMLGDRAVAETLDDVARTALRTRADLTSGSRDRAR